MARPPSIQLRAQSASENAAPSLPCLTSRVRLERCPGEAEVERRETLLTADCHGHVAGAGTPHARMFPTEAILSRHGLSEH